MDKQLPQLVCEIVGHDLGVLDLGPCLRCGFIWFVGHNTRFDMQFLNQLPRYHGPSEGERTHIRNQAAPARSLKSLFELLP